MTSAPAREAANWRRGTGAAPSPVYLARLAALRTFVEELGRTFRRGEDAAAWLDRPASVFGGETPLRPRLTGLRRQAALTRCARTLGVSRAAQRTPDELTA